MSIAALNAQIVQDCMAGRPMTKHLDQLSAHQMSIWPGRMMLYMICNVGSCMLAHRIRIKAHLVGTWQERSAGMPVNCFIIRNVVLKLQKPVHMTICHEDLFGSAGLPMHKAILVRP